MRHMVAYPLGSAGHEVISAENGAEALEIARGRPVDLVLTDVNMPRMDGISLVRELRRLSDYRLTPMLVLTTESGAERKQQGREAGACGRMVKPFNPDDLRKLVERYLKPDAARKTAGA